MCVCICRKKLTHCPCMQHESCFVLGMWSKGLVCSSHTSHYYSLHASKKCGCTYAKLDTANDKTLGRHTLLPCFFHLWAFIYISEDCTHLSTPFGVQLVNIMIFMLYHQIQIPACCVLHIHTCTQYFYLTDSLVPLCIMYIKPSFFGAMVVFWAVIRITHNYA